MALYRDPRDKRIFVPNRSGGVVLDFGHPIAWAILVCTTIIPFTVVIVMTILVLS